MISISVNRDYNYPKRVLIFVLHYRQFFVLRTKYFQIISRYLIIVLCILLSEIKLTYRK